MPHNLSSNMATIYWLLTHRVDKEKVLWFILKRRSLPPIMANKETQEQEKTPTSEYKFGISWTGKLSLLFFPTKLSHSTPCTA